MTLDHDHNLEDDDECPACGAGPGDRQSNKPDEPQGLAKCQFCGGGKCCVCDMGDDVACLGCGRDDAEPGDDSFLIPTPDADADADDESFRLPG